MAAAQGFFSFAALNVADLAGFGVALAAQLNVWLGDHHHRFQELVEAVANLRQSIFDQSVFNQELVNRVQLVEINGNGIVERIANWAVQSDEKTQSNRIEMDTRREEINELARQAQVKFLEVNSGSEAVKTDLRQFISQSDHRLRVIEDRLDNLALTAQTGIPGVVFNAVSTAQEDPMWRRDDPWRRAQTPWSGGAGAAPGAFAPAGAAQT